VRIKTIRLQNFQAHADLTVHLSPAITTLQGPTDAGKSSIIRALRWVCLNDFSGDDFIREGTKRAEVQIWIVHKQQSSEIARSKGSSHENLYTLKGKPFKAFGQSGVPDPIAQLLQLTELNFQGQHDAPFWLALSAPEVSRQLNAVIDLSVIDTALSTVATEVRSAQERIRLVQERLEEVQRGLTELEPSRQRIEDFEGLVLRQDRHTRRCLRYEDLHILLSHIAANDVKERWDRAEEAEAIWALGRTYRGAHKRWEALNELISYAESLVYQKNPPPNFLHLEVMEETLTKFQERYDRLGELIRRIQEARFAVDARRAVFEAAENHFHLNSKGQTCPTCGQIIK